MDLKSKTVSINAGQRYRFPTHVNDLLLDRKDTERSEVFLVVLEPGEAPPLHCHSDTEQVFCILEGSGQLRTGKQGTNRKKVKAGQVVFIPRNMAHTIINKGKVDLRYVAVNVLLNRTVKEPTWDTHVEKVCKGFGWDIKAIRQPKRKTRR